MNPKKHCVALALFSFSLFQPAELPARTRAEPRLWALHVEQAGDSHIVLSLEGQALKRPELAYRNENSLTLALEGVRFPALNYERDLDTPLVPHISAEESDRGTLVTLFCEEPLQLGDVRGAGSGHMRIRFTKGGRAESREQTPLWREGENAGRISSRKISMNLKDCDLADVFRLLGAMADVNIVVDASVPQNARMTLAFSEAPFEEVFQFVLRSQNLGFSVVGRTVVVGAKNSLGLLTGRLTTKSYHVAYAEAQKTAPLLKELAELHSPANRVLVDERQNLIVVTGTAFQQEKVRRTLRLLDAPGRQVMLKARIIEVNDDASDQLETALNAVYDWWWGSYQNGALSAGFAQSGRKPGTAEGALGNLDTSANLPGEIGSGIVQLAGTATRMLDFRLRTLVEQKKARVLADPTVTVLDGEKATVKLVEKLKYVSRRDDAQNPTYDDEEVGPKLEVTPRIGRSGMITVSVSLATGEVIQWIRGGQGEQIPQTNSRTVETKIRVRDGEPFVIGGLFKESRSRTRTSVPILSSIPLIGELFKAKLDKKTRSQVVMILIPYILEIPDLADGR